MGAIPRGDDPRVAVAVRGGVAPPNVDDINVDDINGDDIIVDDINWDHTA